MQVYGAARQTGASQVTEVRGVTFTGFKKATYRLLTACLMGEVAVYVNEPQGRSKAKTIFFCV